MVPAGGRGDDVACRVGEGLARGACRGDSWYFVICTRFHENNYISDSVHYKLGSEGVNILLRVLCRISLLSQTLKCVCVHPRLRLRLVPNWIYIKFHRWMQKVPKFKCPKYLFFTYKFLSFHSVVNIKQKLNHARLFIVFSVNNYGSVFNGAIEKPASSKSQSTSLRRIHIWHLYRIVKLLLPSLVTWISPLLCLNTNNITTTVWSSLISNNKRN